jgi:hypothetical protein
MKHVVAVIDRSGSMESIANDMNGGILTWLREMVATDPEALLTSITFDEEFDVTNERTPVKDVKPSSLRIRPRGGTALNDAIMRGLGTINDGEDALVFVVTDGQENASRESTIKQVRDRIVALEKQGVVFQYLSAAASAFTDSAAYGISRAQTLAYAPSAGGTLSVSNTLRASTQAYMTNTQIPDAFDFSETEEEDVTTGGNFYGTVKNRS